VQAAVQELRIDRQVVRGSDAWVSGEDVERRNGSSGFPGAIAVMGHGQPELPNDPNDAKSALRRSTLHARTKFRKFLG
jgi:hypothetical protein